MKNLIIFSLILVLAGCSNDPEEIGKESNASRHIEVSAPGFEGCKIADINIKYGSVMLARCPNSSTSVEYKSGKTTINTISVDQARQIVQDDDARKQALSRISPEDRKILGLDK